MTFEVQVCRTDAVACIGCDGPPILTAIRREQATLGSPPVALCHRCFGSWLLGAIPHPELTGVPYSTPPERYLD
jgi:hypothetical protein